MEVTNLQAVVYYNHVSNIRKKKLPVIVLFSLRHNLNLLKDQIAAYEETRAELMESIKDEKLLNVELSKVLATAVEQPIKSISVQELAIIDSREDYDKLTYEELDAIGFVISDSINPIMDETLPSAN